MIAANAGAATTTVTIRNTADSANVIVATVDADGKTHLMKLRAQVRATGMNTKLPGVRVSAGCLRLELVRPNLLHLSSKVNLLL